MVTILYELGEPCPLYSMWRAGSPAPPRSHVAQQLQMWQPTEVAYVSAFAPHCLAVSIVEELTYLLVCQ